MSEHFDWIKDPSVAVQNQPALAIYQNPYGHVVIRREADWHEDEDAFVTVAPENLVAVLYGMIDAAGLPFDIVERCAGGYCDVERPERQMPTREDTAPRLALPAPSQNEPQPELALNGGRDA